VIICNKPRRKIVSPFVKRKLVLGWLTVAGLAGPLMAQSLPRGELPPNFQRLEFSVGGILREALFYVPRQAATTNSPLVFVFHGHGGNARNAVRSFALDRAWPEALSIYPQGLNTPGKLTDPEGRRAGWQNRPGDQQDRDLAFFDAMLARLKADYRVDTNRVYATGHSNGGGFTFLLWAERGAEFAAVAPSAAVAPYENRLRPKPVLHLAGEADALVKFAWQERMMMAERRVNGCDAAGRPYAPQATIYSSPSGPPVVTFIHPGGHEFHRDAPALITRFFQEHVRP
jgi:polyhydroxybutyrate depolymerase